MGPWDRSVHLMNITGAAPACLCPGEHRYVGTWLKGSGCLAGRHSGMVVWDHLRDPLVGRAATR